VASAFAALQPHESAALYYPAAPPGRQSANATLAGMGLEKDQNTNGSGKETDDPKKGSVNEIAIFSTGLYHPARRG